MSSSWVDLQCSNNKVWIRSNKNRKRAVQSGNRSLLLSLGSGGSHSRRDASHNGRWLFITRTAQNTLRWLLRRQSYILKVWESALVVNRVAWSKLGQKLPTDLGYENILVESLHSPVPHPMQHSISDPRSSKLDTHTPYSHDKLISIWQMGFSVVHRLRGIEPTDGGEGRALMSRPRKYLWKTYFWSRLITLFSWLSNNHARARQ